MLITSVVMLGNLVSLRDVSVCILLLCSSMRADDAGVWYGVAQRNPLSRRGIKESLMLGMVVGNK